MTPQISQMFWQRKPGNLSEHPRTKTPGSSTFSAVAVQEGLGIRKRWKVMWFLPVSDVTWHLQLVEHEGHGRDATKWRAGVVWGRLQPRSQKLSTVVSDFVNTMTGSWHIWNMMEHNSGGTRATQGSRVYRLLMVMHLPFLLLYLILCLCRRNCGSVELMSMACLFQGCQHKICSNSNPTLTIRHYIPCTQSSLRNSPSAVTALTMKFVMADTWISWNKSPRCRPR